MTETTPRKLLLMEDNDSFAHMFARRMRHEGYLVDVAADGPRGVAMSREGGYSALVIDHGLPGLSGLDVIRTLAQKGPLPPTIMLTSTGSEQLSVEALQLGVDDYIVKDANLACLKLFPVILHRVLDRRQRLQDEKGSWQKIKQDKELLELAFLNLEPDGVLLIATNGIICQVNQAIAHVLGFGSEELNGQPYDSFLVWDEPSKQRAWFEDFVQRAGLHRGQITLKTRRGESLPMMLTAKTLLGQHGVVMTLSTRGLDTGSVQTPSEARRKYADAERCLEDAVGRLGDWAQAVQQIANFKKDMLKLLDADVMTSLSCIREFGESLVQGEGKTLNKDQVQRLVASCRVIQEILGDFSQKVETEWQGPAD